MPKKRTAGSWDKGQSGNPSGRPARPVTELIAAAMNGTPDAVIRKLEELALAGDVHAAKWFADRCFPQYRNTVQPVQLPSVAAAETLTEKAAAILAEVAAGNLSPDVGSQLITAIGQTARVAEIDELTARMNAVEDAIKNARP